MKKRQVKKLMEFAMVFVDPEQCEALDKKYERIAKRMELAGSYKKISSHIDFFYDNMHKCVQKKFVVDTGDAWYLTTTFANRCKKMFPELFEKIKNQRFV